MIPSTCSTLLLYDAGVLDKAEFAKLLKKSGLNFSPQKIMRVMAASDTNDDGVIQYDEFVPVATKMLKSKKGSKVSAAMLLST